MNNIFDLAEPFIEGLEEETEEYSNFLSHLELLIPRQLRNSYDEWKHESFDGIFYENIILDNNSYNIYGMAVLVSTQCMIPIRICVYTSEDKRSVVKIICNIASILGDEKTKLPYSSSTWRKKMYLMDESTFEWKYIMELKDGGNGTFIDDVT